MRAPIRYSLIALCALGLTLCLHGCSPLGLRLPWGLSNLPWTIAFQDPEGRLTTIGRQGSSVLFGQPLAEKGAAPSPTGAHVAVVTAGGELWVVPVVAGKPVRLAAAPVATDFWPEVSPWSADGRSLVYVSKGDVYFRRLTRRARRLTTTADAFTAALSPDGKLVAYGRKDARETDLGLWVVAVGGGQPRQVAAAGGDVYSACCPHWSDDGQWLAFLQAYEGGAVGLTRADGTDCRPGLEPAWEPLRWLADGSTVLFPRLAYGDSPDGLWSYSVSARKSRLLLARGREATYALSPSRKQALLADCAPSLKALPTQTRLQIVDLPAGTASGKPLIVRGQVGHCYWSPGGDLAALSVQGQQAQMLLSRKGLADLHPLAPARSIAGWVRAR